MNIFNSAVVTRRDRRVTYVFDSDVLDDEGTFERVKISIWHSKEYKAYRSSVSRCDARHIGEGGMFTMEHVSPSEDFSTILNEKVARYGDKSFDHFVMRTINEVHTILELEGAVKPNVYRMMKLAESIVSVKN
jgi:hypothetical protein